MTRCGSAEAGAFISSVVRFVDCQAEVLGSGSWRALAVPGSTLSLMLTTFLTLLIAFVGYNLLLGRSFSVRMGVLTVVKIGIVLTLATSWPAYRTLVYDLVVDGPGEIVREIGPQAGVVGSDGTLLRRLDLADRALAHLAVLGPGNAAADYVQTSGQLIVPPPFANFNAFALGGSRIVFLVSSIGSLAALRLLCGLLLALGPFFIAFLLFDGTRSLFEGWVRVIAGAAIGGIAVSMLLGLQLALLEPWLADALTRRLAREALPSVPTELLVLISVFSLALIVSLVAIVRLTNSFRLAPLQAWIQSTIAAEPRIEGRSSERVGVNNPASERSRAAVIADSVATSHSRALTIRSTARTAETGSRTVTGPALADGSGARIYALGHSHRRQVRGRVTTSASRRDSRS